MPDPLYSGRFTQAWAIVPSDTSPLQGPLDSSNLPVTSCSGIHALSTGSVTARFKDDRANGTVTFPVVAGYTYWFALSQVYTTTTASLLALR